MQWNPCDQQLPASVLTLRSCGDLAPWAHGPGPWPKARAPKLNWPLARNGPGPTKWAKKICQGHIFLSGPLEGQAPHPDKKMWAWQIFLAHLVGPGPFLASGQLSLVVRGVHENEGLCGYVLLNSDFIFLATHTTKIRFHV